jgi:hypothetical protein
LFERLELVGANTGADGGGTHLYEYRRRGSGFA